jgi:hypothetical protein
MGRRPITYAGPVRENSRRGSRSTVARGGRTWKHRVFLAIVAGAMVTLAASIAGIIGLLGARSLSDSSLRLPVVQGLTAAGLQSHGTFILGAPAVLSWNSISGARVYRVQITAVRPDISLSSNSLFRNPERTSLTREAWYAWTAPNRGNYAWRVQAGFTSGWDSYTKPREIAVVRASRAHLVVRPAHRSRRHRRSRASLSNRSATATTAVSRSQKALPSGRTAASPRATPAPTHAATPVPQRSTAHSAPIQIPAPVRQTTQPPTGHQCIPMYTC